MTLRPSISIVGSTVSSTSSDELFQPNLDSEYETRVLLIIPDDQYIKSPNKSFQDILDTDTDFKNESLPQFHILEWKNEAIKSGSFEIKNYMDLAKQISNKYLDYDGFVILDSISTIPFTASYLSFMFENLAKPIVITGSYSNSMNQIFSDAKSNLLRSLIIAGYTDICEVIVCFNKKIFRGNRISRHAVSSLDPFRTYNYPILGRFAATDILLTNHCMRDTVKKRFKAFTKLFPNVIVIHLIPQLTDNILKTLLYTQLTKKKKMRRHSTKTQTFEPSLDQTASASFSPLYSPSKSQNILNRSPISIENKVSKSSKSFPAFESPRNISFTLDDNTNHDDNANISSNKKSSFFSLPAKPKQNKPKKSVLDKINEDKNKNVDGLRLSQPSKSMPSPNKASPAKLNRVHSIRTSKSKYGSFKSSLKGVIISFFGVGNAPSRQSFKEILKTAINQYDCEIVITCQSFKGGVDTTVYQSGNSLSDLNLITASDMTTECCVAKLSYLMGKGYRGKQLKEQFETNLRGELTESYEKKRRIVQHIPMDHSESEEIIEMTDDEEEEEEDNNNNNNNNNKSKSIVDTLL